ncbi:unnamed protein product, partial [Cyprideis torosa]
MRSDEIPRPPTPPPPESVFRPILTPPSCTSPSPGSNTGVRHIPSTPEMASILRQYDASPKTPGNAKLSNGADEKDFAQLVAETSPIPGIDEEYDSEPLETARAGASDSLSPTPEPRTNSSTSQHWKPIGSTETPLSPTSSSTSSCGSSNDTVIVQGSAVALNSSEHRDPRGPGRPSREPGRAQVSPSFLPVPTFLKTCQRFTSDSRVSAAVENPTEPSCNSLELAPTGDERLEESTKSAFMPATLSSKPTTSSQKSEASDIEKQTLELEKKSLKQKEKELELNNKERELEWAKKQLEWEKKELKRLEEEKHRQWALEEQQRKLEEQQRKVEEKERKVEEQQRKLRWRLEELDRPGENTLGTVKTENDDDVQVICNVKVEPELRQKRERWRELFKKNINSSNHVEISDLLIGKKEAIPIPRLVEHFCNIDADSSLSEVLFHFVNLVIVMLQKNWTFNALIESNRFIEIVLPLFTMFEESLADQLISLLPLRTLNNILSLLAQSCIYFSAENDRQQPFLQFLQKVQMQLHPQQTNLAPQSSHTSRSLEHAHPESPPVDPSVEHTFRHQSGIPVLVSGSFAPKSPQTSESDPVPVPPPTKFPRARSGSHSSSSSPLDLSSEFLVAPSTSASLPQPVPPPTRFPSGGHSLPSGSCHPIALPPQLVPAPVGFTKSSGGNQSPPLLIPSINPSSCVRPSVSRLQMQSSEPVHDSMQPPAYGSSCYGQPSAAGAIAGQPSVQGSRSSGSARHPRPYPPPPPPRYL